MNSVISVRHMIAAKPHTCGAGHRYYTEGDLKTGCPYCQARLIEDLQRRINNAMPGLVTR